MLFLYKDMAGYCFNLIKLYIMDNKEETKVKGGGMGLIFLIVVVVIAALTLLKVVMD